MKRKAFTFWLLSVSAFVLSCDEQKLNNPVLTIADGAVYSKWYGLRMFTDFEKGLTCSRKLNRPIFLMFTGYTLSDHSFRDKMAHQPEVKKFLSHDFVPIILYVDDKAKLPINEMDSTIINDKKISIETIGNLNTLIQITEFKKASQPYYLLLDPMGKNLVEPWGYDPDPLAFTRRFNEALSVLEKRFQK